MTNLALRLVEKDTMDKQKALEAALGQIERNYGKGSIMKLGQQQAVEVESVPTGSLGLDIALGIGGLPRGRVVELEGEMGDNHVGLHARLMSQALRKLTGSINRSRTMVIFINQIRMKIGVMFGSPETTSGGQALKFYSSVRLDIRRIGQIKDRDNVVGNQTRVKVVKNKVAPPFKVVEFDIMYGEGVSKTGELLDLGVNAGIIEKSGAWFSYNDQRIGQGRENSKTFLKENPEIAREIEHRIRENAGILSEAMLEGPTAEDDVGDGSDAGAKEAAVAEKS
jgi:recombination protein RecA